MLHQPGQFAVLDVEDHPILRHWYAVYPAPVAVVGGGERFWITCRRAEMLRLRWRAKEIVKWSEYIA